MARLLDQIVGHSEVIEKLLQAYAENRLPSTFLFVGPTGVGKKTVAWALAQSLVCEHAVEKNPMACGKCAACLRMEQKASEALLWIEPDKNQIKIEQAHQILDYLSLRSISKSRVIIVDGAEGLNSQAANSLLKVLEEPPGNTYFFMMAPSSQHVLPTIRSRSQIVAFAPLSVQEMKRKSLAPDWALAASQGSFEKLAHLQENDQQEARKDAIQFLQMRLANPRAYLLPEWRDIVRERAHALQVAKHLSLLLRDAVLLQAGSSSQALLNPDQIPILEKFSAWSSEQLLSFSHKALDLENALLAHRDSQLVFEEFWLS